MNALKCRTLGATRAREHLKMHPLLKGTCVNPGKRYRLDQSNTRACTPSYSNRWCFSVHRTENLIVVKAEYALTILALLFAFHAITLEQRSFKENPIIFLTSVAR